MAKLHFSLVAPERELFSGDVDLVQAPGSEGEVTVKDGATTKVFDIQGGFADVGPEGLTILAEHAAEAV
jgi:F-type H+-transporting ATPase subunit epsilon